MKKLLLFVSIFALMSTALNAQVTIGKDQKPNNNAVLELVSPNNNKGFLPPRVALENPHSASPLTAHVEGMVVYNTNQVKDSLTVGLYMNSGTQWVALRQAPYLMPNWFYIPAFPINISVAKTYTVNLWEQYKAQVENKMVANPNASSLLPKLNSATDLDYYVVGYDSKVFDNVDITDVGILSYRITSANFNNISDSTYMNIVVAIK